MPLQGTPEPEQLRPGKCTKCRAHLGQCPCRAPWSLSRVDPGSTRRLGLWQTQCGPSTASTPHTGQWCLFAVSLPPHNTTKQVSLNKWPPSPPCIRAEIRHGTTVWFQIGKGVRQGCILSPCLFNFYVEYILRNAGLDEAQAGIKIAGRNINNLRYTDDIILMT